MNNNPDELVDILQISHSLPIGRTSPRQNYTGMYGFVTMDLSITAVCVQNFQGANCTQCVSGFTGTLCDMDIDECIQVNCSGNGQCINQIGGFSCTCNSGFSGTLCEISAGTCDSNLTVCNCHIISGSHAINRFHHWWSIGRRSVSCLDCLPGCGSSDPCCRMEEAYSLLQRYIDRCGQNTVVAHECMCLNQLHSIMYEVIG